MKLPRLTAHAKERIRERFNVKEGGEQAFFDRHFPKAALITDAINDKGNVVQYFITGDVMFIVSALDNAVTTVERKGYLIAGSQRSFKSRIQSFIKSEIDRIKSAGDSAEQFAQLLKTDVIAELAERYEELKRARSLSKKLALRGRIAALEERLGEIPADIRKARDEVRKQINGALAHY